MAFKLTEFTNPKGLESRLTVKVTRILKSDITERHDFAFILSDQDLIKHADQLKGYSALITSPHVKVDFPDDLTLPVIAVSMVDELKEDYIVTIEPGTGFMRIVYRPESPHNTIFATDRCNSNCLMCSQPPKDVDDSDLINEHLRIISLIDHPPEVLGITGGEPTLLGDNLIELITALKAQCPHTHVHMLTNGRLYQDSSFTRKLAHVRHPSFISAIPLYGDIAGIHDYIVQAQGAFDQTVEGLYNAAEDGLAVEIRIVLHKQSIPRLEQLAEFIYWNFPFASHVAFMGLENMGYVKKNWETLWIDPVDYMPQLESAIRYLFLRRMNISIYNIQLCLLPQALWSFARKSISDFKNIYLDECTPCSKVAQCCGFFQSQLNRHSEHIHTL